MILGEEIYQYDKDKRVVSVTKTKIDGIGEVRIYRRRGLKYIRVSIARDGSSVRLSIPWYVPKAAGISYLLTKKDWIKKHKKTKNNTWTNGQALTNKYSLGIYISGNKRSKWEVDSDVLRVYLPESADGKQRQLLVDRCIKEFLKKEAERMLLPEIKKVAAENDFKFKSVRLKSLKARWGSCNHEKVITLNTSLIRLPDNLISYVIVHELAHTKQLNHGKKFWQEVERILPDYKDTKKLLKSFDPASIA